MLGLQSINVSKRGPWNWNARHIYRSNPCVVAPPRPLPGWPVPSGGLSERPERWCCNNKTNSSNYEKHLQVRSKLAWIPMMVTTRAVTTRGEGAESPPGGAVPFVVMYAVRLPMSLTATSRCCSSFCWVKFSGLEVRWVRTGFDTDRCRLGFVNVARGCRRPFRNRRLLISLHWFAGMSKKKLLGFLGKSQHKISLPPEERVIKNKSLDGGNRANSIQ